MFSAMGALFISIAWATLADYYFRKSDVLINADSVVVKTSLYGREKVRQYSLNTGSHARQWYARRGPDARPADGP